MDKRDKAQGPSNLLPSIHRHFQDHLNVFPYFIFNKTITENLVETARQSRTMVCIFTQLLVITFYFSCRLNNMMLV